MLLDRPLLFPFVSTQRRAFSPFRRPSSASSGPQSVTNVQKLALPPATAVGTLVSVSDGFVVSGADIESCNAFYADAGVSHGKRLYNFASGGTGQRPQVAWLTAYWSIANDDGDQYTSSEDVEFPWLVTTWTPVGFGASVAPTFTHPAIQQLAAPSTAQGGVFVSGGTQDGVFAATGTLGGKVVYVLLGLGNLDSGIGVVEWNQQTANAWEIVDVDFGSPLYYSLSDVATPNLASNWKNASDDTAASITVTSVTQGELYAGLAVSNDGVTNGSSYVSQPFHGRQYYMGLNGGGSNNMHWDTDFNVWTDDVGEWTASNVAFPWQGTDAHSSHNGATFARNNVANEANWTEA